MALIQPWAIDGAKLNGAQARSQLFKATSGARGVTLPGDLKVKALPTPGAFVRIAPGGATLPNDYLDDAGGQSYGTLMVASEDVPVPATGSGGGATRYVIQRIIDPEYSGQTPADPLTYRYDPFVLVSSISNLAYPWVPLAKINQPANTATITQAMITDLRRVANPRIEPGLRTYAMLSADAENLTTTTGGDGQSSGGQTWPTATEAAWGSLDIPEWATRAKIVMMWTGVKANGGNIFGHTWVQIGATVNADNKKTQAVKYDTTGSTGTGRLTLVAADEISIPASMRGISQKFYPRGRRDGGSDSGKFLTLDGGSAMILQVEFMERAD